MKRCMKGKSCGATCIDRSERCVLELGPEISRALGDARQKLGIGKIREEVRAAGAKGWRGKFKEIQKQVEEELGGKALKQQKDLQELRDRLVDKGLIPPSRKSEDAGALFAKQLQPERPKFTPLPTDIKAQLDALGKPPAEAPRQLSKSPGGARMRPPAEPPKRGETSLMNSDLSRLMKGETPKHMDIASAPGEGGIKGRMKPETSGPGSATGNTKWARLDAKDHDDGLGKVRREGDAKYDGWNGSYGSGARKIGEGAYGTVIRNPDGTFIKRGDIADTEAALIKRLGEAGIGPKLIAADINGPARYHQEKGGPVEMRNGRIAMGQVEGKPIGMVTAYREINGKPAADIYWKAMAELHRLGIAHNDAHVDNILVDSKGRGRWVDMGLAQASPKAALAEALGIFNTLKGAEATRVPGAAGQGNWQTRRWDGTGVKAAELAREQGGLKQRMFERDLPITARVFDNRGLAQYRLMHMGLSRADVSTIIDHGIRSPLESYTKGPWAKITDAQAQEVLNILYDGI